MAKAVIFCDGASKGNPGPGGWGAVVLKGKNVKEIGGADNHTTNNAMELTAAIESLREVNLSEAILYTDSSYLINGITKWVYLWEKNGWKTKNKKKVANFWLWEALLIEAGKVAVTWKHVSGHSGIKGNERADKIASSFAGGRIPKLFEGDIKDYKIDPLDTTADKEKKERHKKEKSRKKGPIYSYVSLVNGRLKIFKTWEECEKQVKGKSNARYKRVGSKEEEKEIVSEFLKSAE